MLNHSICFCGEIRQDIKTSWLEKRCLFLSCCTVSVCTKFEKVAAVVSLYLSIFCVVLFVILFKYVFFISHHTIVAGYYCFSLVVRVCIHLISPSVIHSFVFLFRDN